MDSQRNKVLLSDTTINISDEIVLQNKIVKFDREIYLNKYVDSIRMGIKKNIVPQFLYNECIDNKNASYYYVDSHDKKSFRSDLIQKLSIEEVEKIIQLADSTTLRRVCSINIEFMPNANVSTWFLLKKRIQN